MDALPSASVHCMELLRYQHRTDFVYDFHFPFPSFFKMDVTAFQTRLFRLSAACIILFLCAFFNREKRVWIVFFHSDLSVSLSSADDDKFSSINC